jgi:hypothetical protein
MEPTANHPHGTGAAITVTTKIVQSESPPMKGPKGLKHGSNLQEAEPQQQESVQAPNWPKIGIVIEPPSIRQVEGNHEPCVGPVIHDKRYHKDLSLVGLQSGFEESPGWRDYYNPNTKSAETEGPYLPENHSRLFPDRPLINKKNFSTETFITAKTLSDGGSIDTADLGSRKLLCLRRPSSGRNLLKAGNIRLKHLIQPKKKTYFHTQPVPQEHQDNAGQLEKLHLTASKKDVRRKIPKTEMERIEVASSQKRIRNKESNTSIVDLNQVEARHGLDRYHQTTLSESWDEIFKSMGGFRAESGVDGDHGHHHGPQSISVGMDAVPLDLPPNSDSPSQHETCASRNLPVKSPPLPGPRTSSMHATGHESPTRQSFEAQVAKLPAQSTPTRRSKSKSANQETLPTEPDMNLRRTGERFKPRLREVRSSEGLSRFGPGPDASQSTIALEAIEAEMNVGRPLSPFTVTALTQPFSINCTPPQPVTAPTEPPIGPLPELPEEFDRADAASRTSSHNSPSKRLSRPAVPPRSHHRRNPSANSASSKVTIRPPSSQKGHHRKNTSLISRSPRKANAISGAQGVPVEGTTSRVYAQQKMTPSLSNNATITGSNQYNLGNSQDLRSPAASEAGQEHDMVDSSACTAEAPRHPNDVLTSRSERIKGLKTRDLAKEKATRIRGRHQCSDLDDRIVVETSSLVDDAEPSSRTPQLSHFPSIPTRPTIVAPDVNSGSSRLASRQESVGRRPSYLSRRSFSNQTSQRILRPIMSQSQIMVLAETDPDTQMFRASTPTGPLQRTESRKADSIVAAKERKIKKRKSKTSVRSQGQATAAAMPNGIPGIKLNGEHTPPRSNPSTHSSDDDDDDDDDDDMERKDGSKSYGGAHHIAALAKEDSDLESLPTKRDIAALKRKEEKRYYKEQILLQKMKREIAELKLATRSLSRGLEQLTTRVEADEQVARIRGYSLIEAEMEPVKGIAERFGRSLSPEDWERFDHSRFGPLQEDSEAGRENSSFRRVKSSRAGDEARPLSLISRFNSVRNSMGESVIGGPPIKDEVIWSQLEGLNRVNFGMERV